MKLADINMNLHMDCFPCFFRQANIALDAASTDTPLRRKVIKAILPDIEAANFDKSPAHASTRMHRRIRNMLGCDPFSALKLKYNDIALELLPSLKETVRLSDNPLVTAARLSIAGNIIDFGIFKDINIEGTVQRALTEPLAIDHTHLLADAIGKADNILYLLDNSGELVFDMLLIAELKKLDKQVTAVVRGEPILNDCTMQDAEHVGMTGLCKVIHNGTDAVGTVLEEAPEEFRQRFIQPGTLIISKGQGNFETLLHNNENIWFLFQAKCEVVADALNLPNGSMILMSNNEMR